MACKRSAVRSRVAPPTHSSDVVQDCPAVGRDGLQNPYNVRVFCEQHVWKGATMSIDIRSTLGAILGASAPDNLSVAPNALNRHSGEERKVRY